jgi:hypothetical protein
VTGSSSRQKQKSELLAAPAGGEIDLDDAERLGEHHVLRVRLACDFGYEPVGLRLLREPS